jgi:RNA polymerase sigma-70 factor (ECF subfamily)
MEESRLIQLCIKEDQKAQECLYKRYAPKFFAIILRYIPGHADAEDVLVESFHKIFLKINTFNNRGSFEGWMKKLVVNDCLMFLRKNKRLTLDLDALDNVQPTEPLMMERDVDAIRLIIDALPNGYKIIFNLYVIEGFKHKEIAELLGISVNTSKSQLIHAKRSIRKSLGLHQGDDVLPECNEDEDI